MDTLTTLNQIDNNNKWINNIKLINVDYNEYYNIDIKFNENHIKIISDCNKYCYFESKNLNVININLLFIFNIKDKSFLNIFKYLDNINTDDNNKIIYDDKYNFYNNLEEKIKYKINYELVKFESKKNINSNNFKIIIPSKLLLNEHQIYSLILNEIIKINSNFTYDHYIYPFENNIYDLRLRLFFKNSNILKDYLEIKITIDSKLYPFYPPKMEILYPKVDIKLILSFLNLNIFKLENWNFNISLEWLTVNIHQQLEPIIDNYIFVDNIINPFEYLLIKLNNLTKNISYDNIIKFDIPKIIKTNNNKLYWNSGTGYGNDSSPKWDIQNFIKEREQINIEIIQILKEINNNINIDNMNYIVNSYLLDYIINETNGINLLNIEKENIIFNEIFIILNQLYNIISREINLFSNFIQNIVNNFKNIVNDILVFCNDDNKNIIDIYNIYNDLLQNLVIQNNEIIYKDEPLSKQLDYENTMKKLQFSIFDELLETHKYYKEKNNKIESKSLNRIITEISSFKSGLPLNYDSTIFLQICTNHINFITFIITGPKDTPYEHGIYEFHAYFPVNYPNKEPQVLLITTGNGTVRFNPNLYNSGKVCLSLLGTWSGSGGESWNPKTSTFLQVLVSIQSLILVDEPYFNEPGHERSINTEQGKKRSLEYNENIIINNIKYAIIEQIKNPPKGYEIIIMEHFKRKKEDIINKINYWITNYSKNKIVLTDLLNEFITLV